MKVCFVVSEIFAWGSYGGYGTITRTLAESLADAGHQVSALVPKRTPEAKAHQADVENLDPLVVYALPHSYWQRLLKKALYRKPEADIYVSVDPRFDSWRSAALNRDAKHVVWFIDPMNFAEYWEHHVERPQQTSAMAKVWGWTVFSGLRFFGRLAVQRADLLCSQREDLAAVRAFPGVGHRPVLDAPNPVMLPSGPIEKSSRPTVLFLGRFDRQKQPEVFFELARSLPDVRFVAAGAASSPSRDASLRSKYGNIANLEMPGIVTGSKKDGLLREAWLLCNTSLREGLPRSFQEALSYECAVVSRHDPDGLVGRFGRVVEDSFEVAVASLLADGSWRERGRLGRAHVQKRYDPKTVAEVHIDLYSALVSRMSDPAS